MKTKTPSTASVLKNQLRKATLLGCSGFAAVVAMLSGGVASASVIDLGAASGFSVLTYNSNNSSSDAFNGAPIGVVQGNWVQSGGGNAQQSNTVILSTGYQNNANPGINGVVMSTQYNNALLAQAWSAATAASTNFAALSPTITLGAIGSSQTITETAVGNYVLNISSINLSQGALTLSAPTGSTFVVNVSGNVTLTGGSQGNGLLIAGGLTSSDVVYNLYGTGTVLSTSGGSNAQQIQGIVLATNGKVQLSPGAVTGELIAQTLQTSSGSLVTAPPPPPPTAVPETSTVAPLIGVFGLVFGAPFLRRRRQVVA